MGPFPAEIPTAVRRSQRLLLAVHVVVSGQQVSGLRFAKEAVTQVVNAHGALVLMKQMVSNGEETYSSPMACREVILRASSRAEV